MAAPNDTSWGDIVGDKGRIGISREWSDHTTFERCVAKVWFWSKWSVSDSSNTFSYGVNGTTNQGSRTINHTVASGSGWSESNQTLLGTFTHDFEKGTSDVTHLLQASFSGVDIVGGTMTASRSYTVFALPKYTVTFVNGYGGTIKSELVSYGYSATAPSNPTRDGYTFTGWSGSYSNVTSDTIITATWTQNKIWTDINVLNPNDVQDMLSAYFDLSYNSGYSTTNLLNEPTDGNAYQLPGTVMTISNIRPYYDYYELDKVIGANHVGNGVYQHTMTENNQIVEIHMKYKSYMATFNANGGTTASPQTITKNYGTALGTLPTTSRAGYTFNGWFTSVSGGTQVTSATTMPANNITYYAQWTINNYTATFNANGGGTVSPSTITKSYGSQLGTLPTVSRTGYTFKGWYTATSGGTKISTTTTLTDNVTYYAQWEEEIKEPQNIYIYKNGYIYARDFVISEKFYLDTDGTIYAPAFNIGNQIYLDKNGLTAAHFIKGLPANAVFITLTDKRGNALIDANNTILIAH